MGVHRPINSTVGKAFSYFTVKCVTSKYQLFENEMKVKKMLQRQLKNKGGNIIELQNDQIIILDYIRTIVSRLTENI